MPAELSIKGTSTTVNTKKFKAKIYYERMLNTAFYKIFSDYFNVIKQNKKLIKQHNIDEIRFFKDKSYLETIDLVNTWDETDVMLKYNGLEINWAFDKYKSSGQIFYTLIIVSELPSDLENHVIYKEILNNALTVSNLRGAYIEMPRNEFSWQRKKLEKRDFTDIFLPKNTLEDLHLFLNVFNKRKKMMRYLMVGNPGTGKTESTLILANELNKDGVTIIKTPVCEQLKEKIELAEVLSPSIILFDDLDLAIGSRTNGGYSPKELQIFLDAMDGTDKITENVGIIATTNSAHLLDLAAQRPGRFEKILMFDKLSKSNIKNIILKSLKYNFNIIGNNGYKGMIDLYCNEKTIDRFFIAGVTGAHIFNSIKMLKLKADLFEDKNCDLNWILNELDIDIKTLDKIRSSGPIKDRLDKKPNGGIGFGASLQEIDDCDGDDCKEAQPAPDIEKGIRRKVQR